MRVLMIGPVPHVYGGISAVTGMILDSELSRRVNLVYLAEGTRQGPPAKLWRFVSTLVQACGLLLRQRIDLLHLHVGDGSSFYRHVLYLALGRLAGVPVLFHWHLPGDARAVASFYQAGGPLRRWLVRWALHSASVVVALSESWRPALAALMSHQRIVVLPNPVDCTAIHPPPEPERRERPNILFLGDFSARKGVRDLLAAAPRVLAKCSEARFLLCGGQPPEDVQALARPLGAAVVFPGFVRETEKQQLLQEATLLVLPSYAEGVPIAVLEAMAAGLPVVTTPVGGVPDFFVDGRNGLLVPPGDVDALATALIRLLADPELRRRIGQANRQLALAQFDVPVYVERLERLYKTIAQDG